MILAEEDNSAAGLHVEAGWGVLHSILDDPVDHPALSARLAAACTSRYILDDLVIADGRLGLETVVSAAVLDVLEEVCGSRHFCRDRRRMRTDV